MIYDNRFFWDFVNERSLENKVLDTYNLYNFVMIGNNF